MSFSSVELQQRFGYWSDVIKYVCSHPSGGGINTYMYTQGSFQTAYYSVRYVHNVFLQFLYDIGFPGLLCIIILFAAGIYVILKSNSRHKYLYLSFYITIYCHSLIDFNFAYIFVMSVLSMIIAFSQNSMMQSEKKSKKFNVGLVLLFLIPAIIICVCSFVTIDTIILERNMKNREVNTAIKRAEFIDKISFKDNTAVIYEAKMYMLKYMTTGNKSYAQKSVSILEKNIKNKDNHSGLLEELSSYYMNEREYDKLHLIMMEYFKLNKFDYAMYKRYYDYLKTTKSDKASDRKKQVNDYYTKNRNSMTKHKIKYFGQSPYSLE